MVMSLINKVGLFLTASIKKKPRPIEKQLELPPDVKAVLALTSQYPRLEQDTVSANDSAMHSLQLRLLFSTEETEAEELSKEGKDDD